MSNRFTYWSKSPAFEQDIKNIISLEEDALESIFEYLDQGHDILEIIEDNTIKDYRSELSDRFNVERRYIVSILRFLSNIAMNYYGGIFDDFNTAFLDLNIDVIETNRFKKVFDKFNSVEEELIEFNKLRILSRTSMPYLLDVEFSNNIRVEFNDDISVRRIPFTIMAIKTDVGEPFVFQMDSGKIRYLMSELSKVYKYNKELEEDEKID